MLIIRLINLARRKVFLNVNIKKKSIRRKKKKKKAALIFLLLIFYVNVFQEKKKFFFFSKNWNILLAKLGKLHTFSVFLKRERERERERERVTAALGGW